MYYIVISEGETHTRTVEKLKFPQHDCKNRTAVCTVAKGKQMTDTGAESAERLRQWDSIFSFLLLSIDKVVNHSGTENISTLARG